MLQHLSKICLERYFDLIDGVLLINLNVAAGEGIFIAFDVVFLGQYLAEAPKFTDSDVAGDAEIPKKLV